MIIGSKNNKLVLSNYLKWPKENGFVPQSVPSVTQTHTHTHTHRSLSRKAIQVKKG